MMASELTAGSTKAGARLHANHRIEPKQLITDNACTYTRNRSLRELLPARGIHHLTTEPYRRRTVGKVDRLLSTNGPRVACGLCYRLRHRARALPHQL